MATCPYGPIYFKYFDLTNFVDRRGNKARGVGQDFFLKKQIFKAIHTAALKVISKNKKYFLLLDRAPGHIAKDVAGFLNEVWGKNYWKLARCQMPMTATWESSHS